MKFKNLLKKQNKYLQVKVQFFFLKTANFTANLKNTQFAEKKNKTLLGKNVKFNLKTEFLTVGKYPQHEEPHLQNHFLESK